MIYLDNNSTTKMDADVFQSMFPYFSEEYGNASNIKNRAGKNANKAVKDSLYLLKECFNAKSSEDFIITSGATEANNLAISGLLMSDSCPKHIIVSCIEHPSVLNVCRWWESRGIRCTFIPVDSNGIVKVDEIEKNITNNTCLISVMSANNEIGTIQPIGKIVEIARKRNILVHTDATQYIYYQFIDVQEIPVDMISFSAHKIHGPKGVGGLYANERARSMLNPIIFGGGQQEGLRSGTLNVPGIVGMAKAAQIQKKEQPIVNVRLLELRNLLLDILQRKVEFQINGDIRSRIPNNLNLIFPNIPANVLISNVPELAISTGSACSSERTNNDSYVLKSIGIQENWARSAIRIGLSKYSTKDEIIYAANRIANVVNELRGKISWV